jgi:hypothetical protein
VPMEQLSELCFRERGRSEGESAARDQDITLDRGCMNADPYRGAKVHGPTFDSAGDRSQQGGAFRQLSKRRAIRRPSYELGEVAFNP